MKYFKSYFTNLTLTCSLIFSFCMFSGCNDEPTNITEEIVTDNTDAEDNDVTENEKLDDRILVVFFSRTGYNYPNQWLDIGHTARVANFITDITGGDSFELIPEVPYPDDYQQTVAIAREELDNDVRPKFKGDIENISDYSIVFVGGPVWHGAVPMIIRTFYETYDLTGKTIVPFTTHAGSGLGDSERLALKYYPDGDILPGLAIQGTNSANSKTDVESWLRRINIID